MDPFRLSLLLIGAVVVAGIYLWGRRQRRRGEDDDLFEVLPPSPHDAAGGVDDWDVIPLPRQADRSTPLEAEQLQELAGLTGRAVKRGLSAAEEAAAQAAFGDGAAAAAEPGKALLVLTVIAQEGTSFTGPTLSDLFETLDLRYGDMQIFHRIDGASGRSVFGVVNIVEPGHFALAQLPDLRTPGLALFLHLPGPLAGIAAFDDLLATARHLAGALEGRVGDQQRHPLNDDAIARMRAVARRFAATA